MEFKLR